MPAKLIVIAFMLALLASPAVLTAAQPKEQGSAYWASVHQRPHELYGFLLRQERKSFDAVLGKPFQEQDRPDHTRACAYHLPGSKRNYLIAYFSQAGEKPSEVDGKAVRLQFTGDEPSGDTGFFGLRLGDPADKVQGILGKPQKITHEKDIDLDFWDFTQANYTLEFTPEHTLYSIQIMDQRFEEVPPLGQSSAVRLLAQAVEGNDWDRVLNLISGDFECYMQKSYFGLHDGPARQVLTDPKSGAHICLQRAAKAILTLGPEMNGVEDESRVWTERTPGTVTKFPANSPLKEVVFDQEAGADRVYEITFR